MTGIGHWPGKLGRYLRRLVLLPHSAAEAAERSRAIAAWISAQDAPREPVVPPTPPAPPAPPVPGGNGAAPPKDAAPAVRRIRLEDLNAVLDEADAVMQHDYAGATRILNQVVIDLPAPPGLDPFGQDYARWVMQCYLDVTGLDRYDAQQHEADTNVPPDLPLGEFFPFSTRDADFVGRYLGGVGLIVSKLGLPVPSRVVEYGIGWGHVAAALARLGHQVACVDIEGKFLTLAARQAAAVGCEVATVHGVFGTSPYANGTTRADAVIFSEAFHHAFDHLAVLRRLRREVLAPGGVLILAAEPVHPAFPMPWGIRPDGHALWAVRRHRWMELGFNENYLLTALLREGFLVSRVQVDALGPFGLLYRARLHEGSVAPGDTLLPQAEEASWAGADGGRRWATGDSQATLDADDRWSSVCVSLHNDQRIALSVSLDAGDDAAVALRLAPGERAEQHLVLPPAGRRLRVRSETAPADTLPRGVAVEGFRYGA